MSNPATHAKVTVPRRPRPQGMTTVAEVADYELRHGIPFFGTCLLTTCHLEKNGYARTRLNGRLRYVHRMVLENHIGRELRRNEEACHSCHRPACISPDHLYVGTHQQNIQDSGKIGRMAWGERSGRSKLTANHIQEIRRRFADGGITKAQLAREYGSSHANIRAILSRKSWHHLPEGG